MHGSQFCHAALSIVFFVEPQTETALLLRQQVDLCGSDSAAVPDLYCLYLQLRPRSVLLSAAVALHQGIAVSGCATTTQCMSACYGLTWS
jgi:hypothetical protein